MTRTVAWEIAENQDAAHHIQNMVRTLLPDSETPEASSDGGDEGRARRASLNGPEKAAQRRASRRPSAFAMSEAIALDPASVLDHEARQAQWADLFHEALLSYRDVLIVAVVVGCD